MKVIKYLVSSLFLMCILLVGSPAFADKTYSLLNSTNYTLVFDKSWQGHTTCDIGGFTPNVAPGGTIYFNVNPNWNAPCTWAGGGYKVFDQKGQYIEYLSINVSHEGSPACTGGFDYYYEINGNPPLIELNCGTDNGTFTG